MANFFYYGCSKLMIAPYDTENDEYDTPWEEKYVKQVGIANGSSSSNKYYGSNKVIFKDSGSAGKSLDVQTSAFSDDFYEQCLGQQIVNGIRMEGPNDVAKPFALGCQLEGDGGGMRMWFLYTTSDVPTLTPATNTDSATEVSMSASMEANSTEITVDGTTVKKTVLYCEYGEANYDTFLDSVPTTVTTPTSGGGGGGGATG